MAVQSTDSVPNPAPPDAEVRAGWVQRVRTRIFHRRVLTVLALAVALALFINWLSPTARITLSVGLFRNRTLVILMVLFTTITLSLLWSAGQEWDAWLFRFINVRAHPIPWVDRAMWLLTQGGNMAVAAAVVAVLYLFKYERIAIEIVLGLLSLWLVVEIVKAITDRARPFTLLKDVRIIGWRALGRSFPSGHTAQAFFIMSLFVHRLELFGISAVVFYGVAALVGFTRMYVGAHYPRDVVAGALIGMVWSFVIMLGSTYFYAGSS